MEQLKKIFIKDTKRETAAMFLTVVYLLFQCYRTFLHPLPAMLLRPIHVASVSLLCALFVPFKTKNKPGFVKFLANAYDWFSYGASIWVLVYHITQYKRLVMRLAYLDPQFWYDRVTCIFVILLIIGGILRTVGLPLVIFICTAIAYGFAAPKLPGILYYQGLNLNKLTELMIMGNAGIYGSALSAASGFLFWMMLFGGLFAGGSCGQVLIDLGLLAGAKSKDASAPAKAAVMSSCLFGMISGSAAANVASTGVFTIPMMKKCGYTPEEAGAIEAVASTGGQIMPPIMGTSAFLMADMLEINYLTIAGAALGPGLIYYIAVFLMVDLLAKKKKAQGIGYELVEIEHEPIIPRLHLLLPIVVLMGAMGFGATIQRSALYAILSVIVLNFIDKKERRRSVSALFGELMAATKRTATVGMPLCGCGIIIGIVTMTGLATRLSIVITSVGSTHLWIGLLIAMLGCMLLGMALPTVAAYLTAYVLFMPTLLKLGIAQLPANMFLFYFGIFAQITPPVCVASYTAAGISGGNSWNTGWKAFTFAMCAFLAPYVFVYQPGVLLMGHITEIVYAIATLLAGTAMLVLGLAGFFKVILPMWIRVLCVVSGILICLPEQKTDIVGYAGAVILLALIFMMALKNKKEVQKA